MGNEYPEMRISKFRAVELISTEVTKGHNWKTVSKILWGMDIWINNIPVVKVLILANVIVWLLLFGKYA